MSKEIEYLPTGSEEHTQPQAVNLLPLSLIIAILS
jgi:hypothetical protein